MTLAIDAFLEAGRLGEEDIDQFLVEHPHSPIVEGPHVTFLYRGSADQVLLQHFIYGLPTSQPFHQVEETDLWYLTIGLRKRSRLQYKLNVVNGEDHRWIRDPRNEDLAFDPFGANSVCHTEGMERPEWTYEHPETRKGTLREMSVRSEAFERDRHFRLYLPARYREVRRYPLLVVHDGDDYVRFSSLKVVLDNLIHRNEIAPMIVALTNPEDRLVEYADDPRHARFVAEELVPFLEAEYPLLEEPASRGLMGASFGGVASLSCAWRYPGQFGRLLLQSGSFAFTDIGTHQRGPSFDPVVRFVNEFRSDPGRPSERVFVSCGTYESLIYENRSMVPLLQSTGMTVHYREARDGHNWENWRDRLRRGLSVLFPGPLWMTYE